MWTMPTRMAAYHLRNSRKHSQMKITAKLVVSMMGGSISSQSTLFRLLAINLHGLDAVEKGSVYVSK